MSTRLLYILSAVGAFALAALLCFIFGSLPNNAFLLLVAGMLIVLLALFGLASLIAAIRAKPKALVRTFGDMMAAILELIFLNI